MDRRRAARRVAAALLCGAALAAAGGAQAWDNQGHMATGAIAFDALARAHPETIAAVEALMAAHPDRARFARELGSAQGPARTRLMFEYMARWPDDIRRTAYDHPDWHYQLRIVSPEGALLAFHNGRAEEAFLHELAVARDARAPAGERAAALCWVFHLVGDMHQPLHAGHWLSARFPATDRAGALAWVRATPGGEPVELHLFWDRAADQPGPEAEAAAALAALAAATLPPSSRSPDPDDPRAAFAAWAGSSRTLARDVVYADGRVEGAVAPADAVVLSPDYVVRARALAVRRIGESGLSLAQVLAARPLPIPAAGG